MKRLRLSQAERQVILISAGIAARRQEMRQRAEQLMAEVDWQRLVEALRVRRLLPALGPRVLGLAEGRPTGDLEAAVEQATEAIRRHAMFLQFVSLRIMASLADAGVVCTPLKGPLLAEAIYGDLGRRFSNDIDLLVSTGQLAVAVEVVRKLGYATPTDYVQDCGLPQLHFLLLSEGQKLPPVELHWRIHWYERDFARERLLPPAAIVPGDWRPDPADELVALLLFYARDGFVDLRLATDLSAWWDVYGAELSPGALDEPIRAYPALARVILVAAKAAERTVGLPANQIIGSMPKLGVRDRLAIRLANPNPTSSGSQLYADMGFIDGLLTPSGDFGEFIRRQVLLPREILDEYSRQAHQERPKSSLDHAARILIRYVFTMIRTVRAPETLH